MATKSVLGGDYTLGERTDEELVDLARAGGSRTGAWDELYRRHAAGARSVARHLLRSRHDADDVVNEAFAGVISAIGNGAGPRTNFRHYLMACVRNGCKKRTWSGNSVSTDPNILEQRHGAVYEDAEQFGEAGLVASAFSSLSTDWQRALWLTAVEERPTEEIARELGRRPAAVAALAHRAREAFAEAYLVQHQQRVTSPACERISPKLAHYVRGRAGDIDTARVEHHLEHCADCSHAVTELRDVNSSLRTLALPTSLAGAGLVAAGVVPIAGVSAAIGIGGRTASVIGAATLAKVAAIAALLIPVAIVATEADGSKPTVQEAAPAGADEGVAVIGEAPGTNGGVPDVVGSADVPASSETTAVPTTDSIDAAAPVTTRAAAADPAALPAPDVVPVGSTAITVPVLPGAPAVTVTPPLISVSPSPSGGTSVVVATPGVAVPSISTPTITVPISTPAIATPIVTTPSIVVPPILVLPSIVVPSVTVPSITVPSITVPVTIPAVVLPPISVPSLAVPLTIPDVTLPKLPLPLPKLPDLLGS